MFSKREKKEEEENLFSPNQNYLFSSLATFSPDNIECRKSFGKQFLHSLLSD